MDIIAIYQVIKYNNNSLGGFSKTVPPVPISNTVVKRFSADDTALVMAWENKSLPGDFSFPDISSTAHFARTNARPLVLRS